MATKATTATEKARLERIGKLLVQLAELQATAASITEELLQLAEGVETTSAKANRAARFFDSTWCSRYAPGTEVGYSWTRPRDFQNMRRLVKLLGVDEVQDRIFTFIKSDDAFYTRPGNRHAFGLFVAGINGFASPQRSGALSAWACPDDPPCGGNVTMHDCEKRATINQGRRERGVALL